MWKITYLDTKTGKRVWYMQIGFENYIDAVSEHNRLINEDKKQHEYHRTRTEFKVQYFRLKASENIENN
jgi:hypothetical protein